jgi:predicted DNA-binding transcriptional regulator YafY
MTKPANRLLTLILLLQRQPCQKAADLAENLGVSIRTLHRYLALLDEMGIPICAERGPYGGFSLVRGYKMPPLIFNPEEATAVSLGTSLVEEMWGELYREAARGALVKLENLLPEAQLEEVRWARRSFVATGLTHPNLDGQADRLGQMRKAIRESRQIEIAYQSASSTVPMARLLDPYAIAFRWGWWYVVGFCHSRQEIRTFRIDRIHELVFLHTTFQTPSDFDARKYMRQEAGRQGQVHAQLRFPVDAASIARLNRLTWDRYEEQADGSVVVAFTAPDLNWAASTILAYSPNIEVIQPLELRNLVRIWARAVMEINEDLQVQ